MRFSFFWFVFLMSFSVSAQIVIEKPWARASAPGATVAGGYMIIRNSGAAPDRLVAGSSPASAKVELHVHIMDNNVMKMRQVSGYDVPAKGSFELKPGGAHLMFIDIKRPFKEGEKVPLKLKFEKAGEISADFHVGRLTEGAPALRH